MEKYNMLLLEHFAATQGLRRNRAQYRSRVKGHISYEQYIMLEVLSSLADHGDVTQAELASACAKDRPTVSRMVDLLVAKGVLTQHEDRSDRRRKKVRITTLGQQTMESVRGLLDE